MPKVKVYNLEGKKEEELDLPEEIFAVELQDDLVHQAVVAQLANSRQVLANTKNRGEVRGGGRKPWKQKGTGRARHGSIRSPLWKGGGVTFGPTTNRNYSKKINKKMKTKALFMVLSSKLKNGDLVVVKDLKLKKGSTKIMRDILNNLQVKGKTIIALAKKNDNVIKSTNNIPKVSTIASNSLNVVDLLKNKTLITDVKGIEKIQETYKL